MGLEDFERELAAEKARDSAHKSRHRDREPDEDRERRHRHHHRSHRHHDSSRRKDDDDEHDERRHRHREKRHRDRDDEDSARRRERKRRRSDSPRQNRPNPRSAEADDKVKVFDSDAADDDDEELVEKVAQLPPPEEEVLDNRDQAAPPQRDAWMQEPSGLDVEIITSRRPKPAPSQFVGASDSHERKMHESEVASHLADLQRDLESDGEGDAVALEDEPAQHDVDYTFGDAGSAWRMTKLRAVYRQAEESKRDVDDVARQRYGDLRDFDDAREEERELDRRRTYGAEYVGLQKPSGELYQERKMAAGVRRASSTRRQGESNEDGRGVPEQAHTMPQSQQSPAAASLDVTALNKLKAQMMKAKLRGAPDAARLEQEYKAAEAASLVSPAQSNVVTLNAMENRMLAGGREGEVTAVSGKRGRERGLVEENEDMSIEDMVRAERRTRNGTGGGEGRAFAERIARDGRFKDDLDYMDDNANKLSKTTARSDAALRGAAVGDFQRVQRALDACPLCHREERSGADALPHAPVVSRATRTFLTLATEPEVSPGGAVIVPVQHRANLLECDDDEWEELRNFMKALTRHYDAQGKGVIFYENAAHTRARHGHAALVAVPLPPHLAETAPAYFKEALLAAAENWSQHKPIIDTQALAARPGYGRWSFRRAMVKEMPYFHVFFSLDGGLGHVVEDESHWPRGDLFAREVIGGMLDRGPEVVKRQGRWERTDRRVEGFRKKWSKWDWTAALLEG